MAADANVKPLTCIVLSPVVRRLCLGQVASRFPWLSLSAYQDVVSAGRLELPCPRAPDPKSGREQSQRLSRQLAQTAHLNSNRTIDIPFLDMRLTAPVPTVGTTVGTRG